MIDNEELLVALCGPGNVEAFKEVKLTSMHLAAVVKAAHGKQFLTTSRGVWQLAARASSDSSTEAQAHARAGARYV